MQELAPFFEMLSDRLDSMDSREWLKLVEAIRQGITRSPEQYLGSVRPAVEVTSVIIHEIFEEFLESHAAPVSDH